MLAYQLANQQGLTFKIAKYVTSHIQEKHKFNTLNKPYYMIHTIPIIISLQLYNTQHCI